MTKYFNYYYIYTSNSNNTNSPFFPTAEPGRRGGPPPQLHRAGEVPLRGPVRALPPPLQGLPEQVMGERGAVVAELLLDR